MQRKRHVKASKASVECFLLNAPNPVTSKSLPPNLTADEPSESWLFKPVDTIIARIPGNPVNHVHTAEMANQSIHSLTLISVRYTHTALDVLLQLVAAHIFAACKSLDLRAMHMQYLDKLRPLLYDSISTALRYVFQEDSTLPAETSRSSDFETLFARSWTENQPQLDNITSMDSISRFVFLLKSLQSTVIDVVATTALDESTKSIYLPDLKRWSDCCTQIILET